MMSASETFWEGDSPQLGETEIHKMVDFPQRELLLKRKAILLEEFTRNGGMEPRSVEDRCKILQQRIDVLESDLSRAGNIDAARRYIEHAPQSDFEAINRDEFMAWFADGQKPPTVVPRSDRNAVITKRRDADFVVVDSSHRDSSMNGVGASHRSKRRRITAKETPPCLRCKILKKRVLLPSPSPPGISLTMKCDSLDNCSHCPEQSFESGVDFWKVLGCVREPLRGLSAVFCPHFARSTRRTIRLRKGGTETINLLLIKSKVSKEKRGRILNLICTYPHFAALEDASWKDFVKRQSLCFASASFEQAIEENVVLNGKEIQTEEYEAPWAILQVISMDQKYLTPTEYNFFTLMRQGNQTSKLEPNSWGLYTQAKQLLRQSVEIYLLERLCSSIASGDMQGPPPFFRSAAAPPNTLVLVDIKSDLEKFLNDFDVICAGRARLTGHSQLACFYALLVFGIVKSMLIDTYSIRSGYEDESPWKDSDALSINSAYKALVSCFCWSSKSDLILDTSSVDFETPFGSAIQETRGMVHQSQWAVRSYRSTKDFLLGLGSGFLAGENYNGFLVQRYGMGTLPTSPLRNTAALTTEYSRGYTNEIYASGSPLILPTTTINRSAGRFSETATPATSTVTGAERISVSSILCAPRADQGSERPSNLPADPTRSGSNALTRSPSNFIFVQNDGAYRERRRHGGRTGALDEDTLKRSREVRKLGSCWNCWIIRMACSEGTPCDRCLRLQGPEKHTCFRTPFSSYAETLIPDHFISEYSSGAIDSLLKDGPTIPTGHATEIEITWCSDIATMIGATIYFPTVGLQQDYESRNGQLLGVRSLPVGIAKSGSPMLEDMCLTWLERGLVEPEHSFVGFGYLTSELSKAVLSSIVSFDKTTQKEKTLLYHLSTAFLALHATSRPILLAGKDAKIVCDKLHFGYHKDMVYSSRLLNLQLKHEMFNIASRALAEGLSQLDKTFRDRDRTVWSLSFAGLLLLCLCLEQIQVLLYNYEQAQKRTGPAVATQPNQRDRDAIETGLFAQISHVFHLRYRTNKKKDSAGFNPMRTNFVNTADVGFAESDVNFIDKMRSILQDNADILRERGESLDQSGTGNAFAQRNSGRLVAKFLLSFAEQEDGQIA